VLAYQLINFFCFLFNCYGKTLPAVAKCTLYISLLSFFVILITVPACAKTHASGQFVFAKFVNETGYESDGMAFIVGLINPNWIFACLDSATHLAEEVPRPERNVPIAIMATVAIGGVTSWFYCISMFFSLQTGVTKLIQSPTGVPILALYHQALDSTAGAIVLETLLTITGFGCLIACHTWSSRICWSFSRDRGFPGHQFMSKVNPTLDVPFIGHCVSCFIVGALGLLYLGSSTAFGSMVTACITLLYVSYSIPILCLWYRRRNIEHGPFWLGKWGVVANVVTLCWTVFSLVMYSFPSTKPVKTSSKFASIHN
jgi:choline transport protein